MKRRRISRADLKVGDVLNRGTAIVVDVAGWWKHPRFREFEQRDGARGFAVAELHSRGWEGLHDDKWRPGVMQVGDIVHINGRSLVAYLDDDNEG